MFRISRYMQLLLNPRHPVRVQQPQGPVVIWNLLRRCNLVCKHCYSISADTDFPGELDTGRVYAVMDDLKSYGVPVLILSGGEPLLRPDIFDISRRAKQRGFYVGLSTNGTLIDEDNIRMIAEAAYDYVGISIDGIGKTHDAFRRMPGAFDLSMRAVRLCKQHGIKVGLRFTLTQDNAVELPQLLTLMDEYDIDKFYLSHLNYSGRGYNNRRDDAYFETTRRSINLLFDHCWRQLQRGIKREYVTGNNDADAVYLIKWAERNVPEQVDVLQQHLERWGGNASGVNIANIDNLGNVHPDTFWWNYDLGNVKRTPFSKIWSHSQDPLMQGLRCSPRPVKGRCAQCRYLSVCNGNTRVRAYRLTGGDAWAEDPGCYLSNEEIGVKGEDMRLGYRDATPVNFYKSVQHSTPS